MEEGSVGRVDHFSPRGISDIKLTGIRDRANSPRQILVFLVASRPPHADTPSRAVMRQQTRLHGLCRHE